MVWLLACGWEELLFCDRGGVAGGVFFFGGAWSWGLKGRGGVGFGDASFFGSAGFGGGASCLISGALVSALVSEGVSFMGGGGAGFGGDSFFGSAGLGGGASCLTSGALASGFSSESVVVCGLPVVFS